MVAALAELEFTARAADQPVGLQWVQEFVARQSTANMPTLRDIASLTAKYFGLRLTDLKSPLRRQALVAGRGVAMYLSRQLTNKSLEQIGAFFGGRDHTTVLHGCRRTEKLLRRDRGTRQAITDLRKLLARPSI